MTANQMVDYWFKAAQEDLDAAQQIITGPKRYTHGLFFVHLALEKLLKGLILQKTQKDPYPVHDLLVLTKQTGLTLDEDMRVKLAEINQFNLRARYEDYKREFYKRATKDYTEKWLQEAKRIFLWIKEQY